MRIVEQTFDSKETTSVEREGLQHLVASAATPQVALVQVDRGDGHLAAAELAQGERGETRSRDPAVGLGELGLHRFGESGDHAIGDVAQNSAAEVIVSGSRSMLPL